MIPAILLPLATASTTFPAADLDTIVAASDSAVYGRVESVRVERVRGTHWTTAKVTGPSGPTVQIRFPGGCIGEVCMSVADGPRIERGEWVVAFLQDGQPTGLNAGLFHVRGVGGLAEPTGMVLDQGSPTVQAPLSTLLEVAGPLLKR